MEVCPKNILCTDECAVLDIDLGKIKASDLDFSNQFKLTINYDGYINGIVIWFDTIFSFGQRPIKLTTSKILLTQAPTWTQLTGNKPFSTSRTISG